MVERYRRIPLTTVATMIRSRAFLLLNLAHFFDHFVVVILPTAALAMGGQD